MEGKEIYEKSYKELISLKKKLDSTTDSVTINFDNLDAVTKENLRLAIYDVIVTRSRSITSVVMRLD
jgi:hypothetical protein